MDKPNQMNPFDFSNGFQLENHSSTAECSTNREQSIGGTHSRQNEAVPTSYVGVEGDKYNNNDRVLKYIDQMLMEEGMYDQQTCMLEESLDFQEKERSFYEALVGPKQPPSADDNYLDVVDPSSRNTHTIYNDVYHTNEMTSVMNRVSYPPQINDFSESEVVLNFQKGVVDANQLLLIGSTMLGTDEGRINSSHLEAKGKKTSEFLEEERSKKLPAVYPESNNAPIHEFDNDLICEIGELEKKFEAYTLQDKGSIHKAEGSRRRRKNQNKIDSEKETIDFRSLLTHCAQSIAANDRLSADVFLKQIREHSSPVGDGEQRLAHYLANGLEARLAGTGSLMQKSLLDKTTTASDYVRAYYTYISSSPFVRVSNCVANKMIMDKSRKKNSARVHIIDFGILYGFQWPTSFKFLSKQEGGPPKLKITGIDFPQTGFRPAERVEETGRRLAHYAKQFNLPFEFYAIAQNWESIKIEDIKLEKGEFVAVNCLYQAENLLDEAGLGESPRTMVLNLIRKIKPDYFVHGVVNAANGVP